MSQWEYKTMTVINGVAIEVKGEERTTKGLVQCLNEYGREGLGVSRSPSLCPSWLYAQPKQREINFQTARLSG
jgi:hypothetical protein